MKNHTIQNKGEATIFENRYLELLTKSSPGAIWGIYIPIIGYFMYHSVAHNDYSIATAIFIFLMGLKSWSLFEYLAHRFLFHWVSSNKIIQKFAYVIHGNHHLYPRDRQRLFMPPVPSLLMSSAIFGTMYLAGGSWAFMYFSGFIFGHLLQASLHYAIHAFAPPFKWMKPLWRNHHLHHYTDEEKGFGISSTIWDHVFGTTFDLKKHKEDEAKVKALMFEKTPSSDSLLSAVNS